MSLPRELQKVISNIKENISIAVINSDVIIDEIRLSYPRRNVYKISMDKAVAYMLGDEKDNNELFIVFEDYGHYHHKGIPSKHVKRYYDWVV